ncbi:DDE-type integrase/transposase/recombinase [Cereibacter sphaeroides]|jgi:putative transposase|uniref:DDE-type integrase/transposase/recombinase n=1 Tax=Cereibacter sphaeroides TaxID=1063 RepID=UPI0000664FDB|nr:Integrase, catalytic region [Cereibacter sphaeroides ATCC 17029]
MNRDAINWIPFQVSEHCRLTIGGKAFRLAYRSGDALVLRPAEGEGPSETFDISRLSRLNALGKIHHEREHFLPPHLRMQAAPPRSGLTMADLTPRHAGRINERYAMTMALIDLHSRGEVSLTYPSVTAAMTTIRVEALKYLANLPDAARLEEVHRALAAGGKVPLPAGVALPKHRSAKTLLGWRKTFLAAGTKLALADDIDQRGDRSTSFGPEEDALLLETVRDNYLTREQKSKVAVTADVKRAFAKANEARRAAGLSDLTVPGRDAVRATIARFDALEVVRARKGEEAAKKMFRTTTTGLEVSRPLERVEIDECRIDLRTILSREGLLKLFTPEEIEAFGLDKKKTRWWAVMAIDCRTRVILALKLTPNPRTSAAVECVRMIMSDKGNFSDKVGALTRWSQRGTPESVVTDGGSGLTSIAFSNACTDLRITDVTAIAGAASARARIERLFQTISKNLLCRLSGRTFSSIVKRGDYDADARACLGTEELCQVLVRWIVDIYHNSWHSGLGCTPLQQWNADMEAGNFPLKALPSLERQRVAFGIPGRYRLTKQGVVILGIAYTSERLARHFAVEGAIMVETRWDHADLGAISVKIGDVWVEVPAVHDRFQSVSAQVWLAARKALRAEAEARKAWSEAVIFKAIDYIEETNARAKLHHRILDQAWTPERLRAFEEELFPTGFRITADTPATRAAAEGIGRSIVPAAPMDACDDAFETTEASGSVEPLRAHTRLTAAPAPEGPSRRSRRRAAGASLEGTRPTAEPRSDTGDATDEEPACFWKTSD